MASGVYNRGAKIITDGTVDWDGATTAGVLLVTSSYTPNKDHNVVTDLTNELSGSGYVRKTSASRTLTENDTLDRVEYDLADITWNALGAAAGTPKYAIIYYEGASTDGTRELIAFIDLGSAPTPDGSNYKVSWDAAGAFQLNT
ncbi:MAG: hypothetical protein ABL912_01910 [Novosphingobium sp.]